MSRKLQAISFLVSGILILSILFISGFTSKTRSEITEVYKVYLDGKEIGLVESKKELEEYIDNQQTMLKKKYKVDNVYPPKGLDIQSYKTYRDKVEKVSDVYDKINDKQPFTVKGYAINIREEDNIKTIYVLDKKIFTNAIDKSIKAFIDEKKYNAYLNNTQAQIKETGSIVENVELEEDISIKEDLISVDKEIFTNQDELTKYLLFGTTEKQATYKVKAGDTINKVAFDNKLNPEEFLIANPYFTDENNLLYEGQEVVIGLINPMFHLAVETHVVEDSVKSYQTQIQYDNNLLVGSEYEKQSGQDGLDRITKKEKYVNGEMVTVVSTNKIELKPAINRIVVKGGKVIPTVGETGSWGWPTVQGYTLSSGYGWRWGTMHTGTDIAGVGHGSPIYASNNGTVYKAGYHSTMGNHVMINHNNGYYTNYMHLSSISVKEGQVVSRGQIIGGMGNTGRSYGTHLHFEIWIGGPPHNGGYHVDPLPYLKKR